MQQRTQQRILFGTNNQAKVEIIKAFLEDLPVTLLSPADLGIQVSVREDGLTPEENAEKKARAYFAAAQIPTFALDAALSVEGLPAEKQPGTYVRRIGKTDMEASDQEMLAYYSHELEQVGGSSLGEIFCARKPGTSSGH
jgi:8-oxo-dGTP diphosphatase